MSNPKAVLDHRIEAGTSAAAFEEVAALAEIFGVSLESFRQPVNVA